MAEGHLYTAGMAMIKTGLVSGALIFSFLPVVDQQVMPLYGVSVSVQINRAHVSIEFNRLPGPEYSVNSLGALAPIKISLCQTQWSEDAIRTIVIH
jgi:hypothetical protein